MTESKILKERSLFRRAFRVLGRGLEHLEAFASSVLILAIFGLVIGQVISRYVLESPPFWIEEIARTGMVWLTFISAALVTSKRAHLTMNMLAERLGGRINRALKYAGEAMILVVSITMVPASWHLITTLGDVASSSGFLPRSVLFFAPCLGFGLMALHSLFNLFSHEDARGEVTL